MESLRALYSRFAHCTNEIIQHLFFNNIGSKSLDELTAKGTITRGELVYMLVKELNKLHNTNDMEAGILVDLHSWEYWIIKGKYKEVVMKDNKYAYTKLLESYKNQLLFMHNHPSTGTFSGVDLNTFCKYESLYIITAVGNDGSIYTLTKQPGFRSDIIMSEYANLIHHYYNYYNNATKAMQDILKNANKFKLEYKKGRKN